jgi:hypothetical protein
LNYEKYTCERERERADKFNGFFALSPALPQIHRFYRYIEHGKKRGHEFLINRVKRASAHAGLDIRAEFFFLSIYYFVEMEYNENYLALMLLLFLFLDYLNIIKK